jgi:type I restriction enzyme S subunit
MITAVDCTILRFKVNEIVPEIFLAYSQTDGYFREIAALSSGSTRQRVSRENLSNIVLALPKLAEQRKIAGCLTTLDEGIAAHSQKLAALQTHKKGLMQQLFPREGETLPRLRFPEFQNAQEWKECTLSDVCRMKAGQFVAASDIKEQPATGLYPCYGGNGLRGYAPTFTNEGTYPLVGRQGALCGNVKLCTGRFHATEHAVVATPENGIDVGWLYYVLDLLNLNRFATGQAQPGLSVDNLEKVALAMPDQEDEQQRIATCLYTLDDLIAAQSAKLEVLKTHKQALMQQLFPSTEEIGS